MTQNYFNSPTDKVKKKGKKKKKIKGNHCNSKETLNVVLLSHFTAYL